MIKISMYDSNDYVISTQLDNIAYKLAFHWNSYGQQWTLDLRNDNDVDIISGIAIVPNMPLFKQYQRHNVPRGEIMAIVVNQEAKNNQTIGRNDFLNGKFSLVYVGEGEVNAILGKTV